MSAACHADLFGLRQVLLYMRGFNETWKDKFVDQWPAKMWPKLRYVYYVYSTGFLFLVTLGLTMILLRSRGIIPTRFGR